MFTIIKELHTAMRTRQIVISTWTTTTTIFCTKNSELKVHKNIFFIFNAAARVWHSIVSFSIVRQRAGRVRSAFCAHTKIQTHKKSKLWVTFCAICAMTTFRAGPGWMCAWASMRRSTWKIWRVKKSRYRLTCTLIFTVCAVWPLLLVYFLWKLTSCSAFFSPMRHHEK